jgi:hypothetical protein
MATSKVTARPLRARTGTGTYFLSLTVENVRCFGPAQILDLSDGHGCHAPWTVILGENGLGKTTLLTCLAVFAAAGWSYEGVSHEEDPEGWPHRWYSLSLDVLLAMFRGGGDLQGRLQAEIVFSNGHRDTTVPEILLHRSHFLADPDKFTRGFVCFYYGAGRRMPKGVPISRYEGNPIFLDDESSLRNPEDWLLRSDYNARLHNSGTDAGRFAAFATRVVDALITILPEVTDLRIQPADRPGWSPQVEARTPDGWVPLRRLGFGYQSQVAWLVDFASRMFERYPDSPDPLAEPAVVLLDEIDLHMHPRWQRQIIGFLTERCPATQFIVTAHSPLVVQAAAGANIVLLRREGDHVVIDNDPEVLDNWRVDQILTSELFGLESARPPQIEEPIKERRALLAKSRLTSRDRARLAELEAEIGELPAGESAEDRRAMELIRRAAAKLQSGA